MRFPPSMPPLCGLTSTGDAAPFHCCTALLSLFTAFGRGEPGDRAVHPVKMCHIGKAHNLADFRDALIRFHKQPLGMSHTQAINILNNGTVGVFFKFPAQIIRTEIKLFGQIIQGDGGCIILVEIMDDAGYTALFLRLCGFCGIAQQQDQNLIQNEIQGLF